MSLPRKIDPLMTKQLRTLYAGMLLANEENVPAGVHCYVVNQNRGFAYYDNKIITVPAWAYLRDRHRGQEGFLLAYLAHELAHQVLFSMGDFETIHGRPFQEAFKLICPAEYQHWEYGYKPREALAAGVSLSGLKDF